MTGYLTLLVSVIFVAHVGKIPGAWAEIGPDATCENWASHRTSFMTHEKGVMTWGSLEQIRRLIGDRTFSEATREGFNSIMGGYSGDPYAQMPKTCRFILAKIAFAETERLVLRKEMACNRSPAPCADPDFVRLKEELGNLKGAIADIQPALEKSFGKFSAPEPLAKGSLNFTVDCAKMGAWCLREDATIKRDGKPWTVKAVDPAGDEVIPKVAKVDTMRSTEMAQRFFSAAHNVNYVIPNATGTECVKPSLPAGEINVEALGHVISYGMPGFCSRSDIAIQMSSWGYELTQNSGWDKTLENMAAGFEKVGEAVSVLGGPATWLLGSSEHYRHAAAHLSAGQSRKTFTQLKLLLLHNQWKYMSGSERGAVAGGTCVRGDPYLVLEQSQASTEQLKGISGDQTAYFAELCQLDPSDPEDFLPYLSEEYLRKHLQMVKEQGLNSVEEAAKLCIWMDQVNNVTEFAKLTREMAIGVLASGAATAVLGTTGGMAWAAAAGISIAADAALLSHAYYDAKDDYENAKGMAHLVGEDYVSRLEMNMEIRETQFKWGMLISVLLNAGTGGTMKIIDATLAKKVTQQLAKIAADEGPAAALKWLEANLKGWGLPQEMVSSLRRYVGTASPEALQKLRGLLGDTVEAGGFSRSSADTMFDDMIAALSGKEATLRSLTAATPTEVTRSAAEARDAATVAAAGAARFADTPEAAQTAVKEALRAHTALEGVTDAELDMIAKQIVSAPDKSIEDIVAGALLFRGGSSAGDSASTVATGPYDQLLAAFGRDVQESGHPKFVPSRDGYGQVLARDLSGSDPHYFWKGSPARINVNGDELIGIIEKVTDDGVEFRISGILDLDGEGNWVKVKPASGELSLDATRAADLRPMLDEDLAVAAIPAKRMKDLERELSDELETIQSRIDSPVSPEDAALAVKEKQGAIALYHFLSESGEDMLRLQAQKEGWDAAALAAKKAELENANRKYIREAVGKCGK